MTGEGVDCPLPQTIEWQSEEVQQTSPVQHIPPDDRMQDVGQKTATKRCQKQFRKVFTILYWIIYLSCVIFQGNSTTVF